MLFYLKLLKNMIKFICIRNADLAQLVEQLIRNE